MVQWVEHLVLGFGSGPHAMVMAPTLKSGSALGMEITWDCPSPLLSLSTPTPPPLTWAHFLSLIQIINKFLEKNFLKRESRERTDSKLFLTLAHGVRSAETRKWENQNHQRDFSHNTYCSLLTDFDSLRRISASQNEG